MARAARVAEVRTENLLTEMLNARGWDTRRPPAGETLRQHEYKDQAHLRDIFLGRSKVRAIGHALPEAVVLDRDTMQPALVIEAKATMHDIDKAVREVTEVYGRACVDAGFSPLAVAIAGTSEDGFAVRVFKWNGSGWAPVTYEGEPIGWIPNREEASRIRVTSGPAELRPSIPSPEVLAAKADEINRLLRESSIRDGLRPAVVGACMLALWKAKDALRKAPEYILKDINQACKEAFIAAGKASLAKSLYVDEANKALQTRARRIIAILELLSVPVLTAEHDYLGQLYETFFRYAGGNTIGQHFTPRHIATFCAELLEVTKEDVVLDPTCGTGGFLIAAMDRMAREGHLSRSDTVKLVPERLFGFDSEPVTAALCVANMILRGDGSSSVHGGDAMSSPAYPVGKATAVLMNPPFPHKKTDRPVEEFIARGLDGLSQGGRLAAIIPSSMLVRKPMGRWRRDLLAKNTLEAVITLPDELFQPYASVTTAIIYVRKGIPHSKSKSVFFAHVERDGLRLKKGIRVPAGPNELPAVLEQFRGAESEGSFSGWKKVEIGGDLSPGAHIPAEAASDAMVDEGVLTAVRSRTAFVATHAADLIALNIEHPRPPLARRKARKLAAIEEGTIGNYFDVVYGLKALHDKSGLGPGRSLVISSSGIDNGCYGFFDFKDVLEPPFVTVPSTGSIAEARVQEWPCGVTDDCLMLVPKGGIPHAALYVAAAIVKREKWRFNYGRKVTPERILDLPVPLDSDLVARIEGYLQRAANVEDQLLEAAEDALDTQVAQRRLSEIESGESEVVRGKALEDRLAALMAD